MEKMAHLRQVELALCYLSLALIVLLFVSISNHCLLL